MAISADVSIDTINKVVRRSGAAGGTVYSVNALYSYIMQFFDDLTLMDDEIPMSAQTPTSYTMINGWYIQEELTQFLDGGAIQTNGYTDEIHVLTLDGTYAGPDDDNLGQQVTDDAADVGALLDYNNTAQKWWIRIGSSTVIGDGSVMSINGDAGVTGDADGDSLTGETIFANPYTLGALEGTPAIYIYQNGLPITSWWVDGQFDILIKVSEADVDIDSKNITVTARVWTDTYSTFEITLTTAGQNAVPLGTQDDLNNVLSEAAAEDLQDGTTATIAISANFGIPYSYDIGDGNGPKDYEVQIDCDGRPLSDVYEVCKYWTRDGSVKQIATEDDVTFVNGEAYRYVKDTYAEVTASPLGTFAGGNFFGARSVYFINLHADDAQAFQLIDKSGVTRNPPNYQSFSVTGVVSGDRVAVYLASAGDVFKEQYTLSGAWNPTNEIIVTSAIPSDTPAIGTFFAVSGDGSEVAYSYTSWSGNTFSTTIAASTYSGGQKAYVPYIYAEAVSDTVTETSTIYTVDRSLICRVRLAGIIPFQTVGTYTSTGYSAAAIRTTDGIYTP